MRTGGRERQQCMPSSPGAPTFTLDLFVWFLFRGYVKGRRFWLQFFVEKSIVRSYHSRIPYSFRTVVHVLIDYKSEYECSKPKSLPERPGSIFVANSRLPSCVRKGLEQVKPRWITH